MRPVSFMNAGADGAADRERMAGRSDKRFSPPLEPAALGDGRHRYREHERTVGRPEISIPADTLARSPPIASGAQPPCAVDHGPAPGALAMILTLPGLKPRDSCELGLLGFRSF